MDHERRWSYTVFLQSLGKYLDLKGDFGEQDFMFHYARESLIHYARWMLENEIPFRQCLDRVEYPTETWIVHDLRKSNVFELAAKYGKMEYRKRFLQRAEFYFQRCFSDLEEFETKTFTRPLVMMMNYGNMHSFFQNYPTTWEESKSHNFNFGQPQMFRPQQSEAFSRAKMIAVFVLLLAGACISMLIKFSCD
jgi:hypothetical protein